MRHLKFVFSETDTDVQKEQPLMLMCSDVDAMTAERGWEMVCMDQKVLKTIATGAPAQHTVTEDII